MDRRRVPSWLTVAVLIASAIGATASLSVTSATPNASPSVVPTFPLHCNAVVWTENVANDAIQLAIDHAAAGQVVCVGPGTFPEQLTISKALTLLGAGRGQTIIEPSTVAFNTVDWDSAPYAGGVPCGSSTCVPLAAIILAESATPPPAASPTHGVSIRDLEVNGAAASSAIACGDDYVGVDFQDAAGSLLGSSVLNVASPVGAFGCQEVSGAVYAYNAYFYSAVTPSPSISVTVATTVVTGFQKNGITCDDPGELCSIAHDQVAGIGPTPLTGQNGIQVAYGASAHLLGDAVSSIAYTGSTATLDWYGSGYQGAGVLLYQAGAGTSVIACTVSDTAIGIAAQGDVSDTIQGNHILESTAYAIVEDGDTTTTASIVGNAIGNAVTMAVGILVDNGSFRVVHNSFYWESPSGTQGASQAVTGAGTIFPTVAAASVSTGAIQAVSEGGATHVVDAANLFTDVSTRLATLAVLTGTVTVT